MSRPLFEHCPICDGKGWVHHSRFPGETHKLTPVPGSLFERFECPGCAGVRFVEVGITVEQLERIVAENHRLRARGKGRAT